MKTLIIFILLLLLIYLSIFIYCDVSNISVISHSFAYDWIYSLIKMINNMLIKR